MLSSVDFDDDAQLLAQEVHDVWAYRDLALEPEAFEAMRAQVIPKPALRIGHVGAQILGVRRGYG